MSARADQPLPAGARDDRARHHIQQRAPLYDKAQEGHYNLISALHKAMRGSDPDAAVLWRDRPGLRQPGRDPGRRAGRGTAGPTPAGRDRRGHRWAPSTTSSSWTSCASSPPANPERPQRCARGCSARPSPGRSAGPARPVPRRPG
ncbi:hypothetical protein AB0B12_40620 [Streptomyces sp. NPDC044780]|uniref:hypothetical protein n=1 Tax=unclassified Streptomyces TaxID=2593676 RepID=UPI0033CD2414